MLITYGTKFIVGVFFVFRKLDIKRCHFKKIDSRYFFIKKRVKNYAKKTYIQVKTLVFD